MGQAEFSDSVAVTAKLSGCPSQMAVSFPPFQVATFLSFKYFLVAIIFQLEIDLGLGKMRTALQHVPEHPLFSGHLPSCLFLLMIL